MRIRVVVGVVLVLLLVASPALARRGGGGNGNGNAGGSTVGSEITLNTTDPRFGDVITFRTSHPEVGETVRIALVCHQADAVVYLWTATESESFTLWSANWSGGEATCAAELYYFEYRGQTQVGRVTLATTSFSVLA